MPTQLSESANNWCHRLLAERVAEELQELYQNARVALGARRKDLRKEEEFGGGELDTPAFRYIVESGQNPQDPAEYYIKRRLELRQGWPTHRAAINELFGSVFDQLVVEFESLDHTFDDLVERLEDIKDEQGGEVNDDDRRQRVTYSREDVTFTFDLRKRQLTISLGQSGALLLIDAAQRLQLGITRQSPMLAAITVPSNIPKRLKCRKTSR